MNYSKALTFVFEDPRWVAKIAVGVGLLIVDGLLSLNPIDVTTGDYAYTLNNCLAILAIPILMIMFGYNVRLLQNVRDGLEAPLPEWNQWWRDLVRGLKVAILNLSWTLVSLVILLPFFCLFSVFLINLVSGDARESALWRPDILFYPVVILSRVFAPSFMIAFAQHERLGDGMNFSLLLGWTRRNIRQVGIVILISVAIYGVQWAMSYIATADRILGFLQALITAPIWLFAMLYLHHLYGQLAVAYPPDGLVAAVAVTPEPSALPPPASEEDLPVSPPVPPAPYDQPPVT